MKIIVGPAYLLLTLLILTICPCFAQTGCNQWLIQEAYNQLKAGANEQAITTLSKVLKDNPASVDARRYLGYAFIQMGLGTKAIRELEYVTRMEPGSPADLVLLADAYFYSSQYKQAAELYEEALKTSPCSESARSGLVHTYIALGETEKATALCTNALNESPAPSSRIHYEDLLCLAQGSHGVQRPPSGR